MPLPGLEQIKATCRRAAPLSRSKPSIVPAHIRALACLRIWASRTAFVGSSIAKLCRSCTGACFDFVSFPLGGGVLWSAFQRDLPVPIPTGSRAGLLPSQVPPAPVQFSTAGACWRLIVCLTARGSLAPSLQCSEPVKRSCLLLLLWVFRAPCTPHVCGRPLWHLSVSWSVGDVVGALAAFLRRVYSPTFVRRWALAACGKKQFWRVACRAILRTRFRSACLARALCQDVLGLSLQPGKTKPHVLSRLTPINNLCPVECASLLAAAPSLAAASRKAAACLTCSPHSHRHSHPFGSDCVLACSLGVLRAWAAHACAVRCTYLACVAVVWCAQRAWHSTHAVGSPQVAWCP